MFFASENFVSQIILIARQSFMNMYFSFDEKFLAIYLGNIWAYLTFDFYRKGHCPVGYKSDYIFSLHRTHHNWYIERDG